MRDAELRRRFDWIGERFDWIGERFDRMDERFERMDERFVRMDERFVRMDERFERIDERFVRMDRRFEQVLRTIIEVNAETRRVLSLEMLNFREELSLRIDAVDQKLDTFIDETHSNFDGVYGRFDRLETEYYAISAGLARVEKKVSEDADA